MKPSSWSSSSSMAASVSSWWASAALSVSVLDMMSWRTLPVNDKRYSTPIFSPVFSPEKKCHSIVKAQVCYCIIHVEVQSTVFNLINTPQKMLLSKNDCFILTSILPRRLEFWNESLIQYRLAQVINRISL